MEKQRMVIYQLLPRLFGNSKLKNRVNGSIEENGCGKFNDINNNALQSIKNLGVTHVWYTGVIEHATCTDYSRHGIVTDFPDIVKGIAGSPYAIKDYYDVAPDLAEDVKQRMQEFEQLITRTRDCGLKVIIDLVPNHLARQYVSDAQPEGVESFGFNDDTSLFFHPDNNFYYLQGTEFKSPINIAGSKSWRENPARVTGNDCFSPEPGVTDWYETVKLNFGLSLQDGDARDFEPLPSTWLKMREVILYWAAKGVDGFRCDMAGMVPIEFWRWVIGEARAFNPNLLFVAEVYNAGDYDDFIFKGGFDFLYDKVVFYDGIRAVMEGKAPASSITSLWQQTDGLHRYLLYFLENHDEQRLASDFFLGSASKAIPGMVVATTMFNNPFLLYSGQELGEKGMDKEGFSGVDGRTTIYDYWSLPLMAQWKGDGSWQGVQFDDETIKLRRFYSLLLNLANENSALCKGKFYDLMWANINNPLFNSENLYAYLRFDRENVLLVIANFADREESYKLKLPPDAMQLAGMNQRMFFNGKDLLGLNNNIQFPGEIAVNNGLGGKIAPFSAAVYQLVARETS